MNDEESQLFVLFASLRLIFSFRIFFNILNFLADLIRLMTFLIVLFLTKYHLYLLFFLRFDLSRCRFIFDNNRRFITWPNTWKAGRFGSKATEDRLGMLFVGFTPNPKILEYMLDRMAGKRGMGQPDPLLSNHKVVKSQLFFVPSRAQVHALAS